MKTFVFCVAMATCSCLNAALPPLYQGMAEFKSVLQDPRFVKELPAGDVLESIAKTEKGFEVTTNRHTVQVDIEYMPQKQPGPAQYVLHFHAAEEKIQAK